MNAGLWFDVEEVHVRASAGNRDPVLFLDAPRFTRGLHHHSTRSICRIVCQDGHHSRVVGDVCGNETDLPRAHRHIDWWRLKLLQLDWLPPWHLAPDEAHGVVRLRR